MPCLFPRLRQPLRHYEHCFSYSRVEQHDWRIDLDSGRRLEFQLSPYLHFPGAMVPFDTVTATLFSSHCYRCCTPCAPPCST